MRHFTIYLLSFVWVAVSSGQSTNNMDLSDYRWKNRVLLVFAPEKSDEISSHMSAQVEANQEAFRDRDMVMISVFESDTSMVDGRAISQTSATRLRDKYSISSGSRSLFLIGKDGGIKLQRGKSVGIQEIFALIDTMPMRRREIN